MSDHEDAPQSAPAQYRFVGSDCEISSLRRFSSFGEQVVFKGGHAEARMHGGPFIPEEDFAAIGFTAEELDRWPNAADHVYYDDKTRKWIRNAPEEFLAKKQKALVILHAIQNPQGNL